MDIADSAPAPLAPTGLVGLNCPGLIDTLDAPGRCIPRIGVGVLGESGEEIGGRGPWSRGMCGEARVSLGSMPLVYTYCF